MCEVSGDVCCVIACMRDGNMHESACAWGMCVKERKKDHQEHCALCANGEGERICGCEGTNR